MKIFSKIAENQWARVKDLWLIPGSQEGHLLIIQFCNNEVLQSTLNQMIKSLEKMEPLIAEPLVI